jgi:hypothetical protein
MKKIITTILLALTLSISVSGGQIYGSLTEDGRPLPAKVIFEVACRDQIYKGETDNYGAYSINVGRGKCTFKLFYRGQTPTFDLYSSASALRYDFDLVRMKEGYQLRRK